VQNDATVQRLTVVDEMSDELTSACTICRVLDSVNDDVNDVASNKCYVRR